ncbi:MAG TPA: YidC/Oxa1 family insertase periplasmic-domain containing protein [Polyangia bacterium]|nr:YidC/Oxa1 family insertase periplasmic-domain containing protein [Polyangia bacterium]
MSGRNTGSFYAAFVAMIALVGCSGGNGAGTPTGAAGSGGGGGATSGGAGGATGSGGAASGSGGATSGGTGGAPTGGTGGQSPADAGKDTPAPDAGPGDAASDVAATGPAMPVQRNGRWAFDLGEVTFEVDPQVGGRITTFALGGRNLLTGPAVNDLYWGSTFWTSPESQWKQPPPTQIDSAPFATTATATSVTMTGPPSPLLGVSISKTFAADRGRGTVQITYKITNTKQVVVHMAPWEITRVAASGLTFFPTGSKSMLSMGATLPTTGEAGITWFTYDAAKISADSKLIADATEGWIAHVDQGVVLIKKFADVPPAQIAPTEGDVELYTNKLHTYIELEDQGAYGDIAPGASTSWTVTWFLKRLPAGVTATAGDAALAAFVRDAVR